MTLKKTLEENYQKMEYMTKNKRLLYKDFKLQPGNIRDKNNIIM